MSKNVSARFSRWLYSTQGFTADYRNQPPYTLALMNGSRRGSVVMDFTESIISIAPTAPHSSSAKTYDH